MKRPRSSATITSAGSSDTDEKALTVMPAGSSPSSVVTTLTPVAKWPMTSRNRSGPGCIVASLRVDRPGALRAIQPSQTRAHDPAEPLEMCPQHGRAGGRETVRPSPVLDGERLDQPTVLEPRERCVE